MTGDSIASLLYLSLLGAAILGYFIASGRQRMGKTLRQLAMWGLIFMGVIAVAGLWPELRQQIVPGQSFTATGEGGGTMTVPQGMDGHYRLTLEVNGTPVDFVVDTGATDLVLSEGDARRVGIDPDGLAYLSRAQTANGTVPMARVRLDEVRLGGLVDRDVGASVNGGEMRGSLLGMSYLSRFGRIAIENGELTLER